MNNRKRKKTWKDTLWTYILLTIAGIILFRIGSDIAYAERGYKAIGGEMFALFLPVYYLAISSTIKDIKESAKNEQQADYVHGKEQKG